MTRTTLLITTLLCFTSLALTASDYPGADSFGNYYPAGSSGSYPGASSGAGAGSYGNYYPSAGGSGSPTPAADNYFDMGNFPGAGSYPGATGPAYSPGAGAPGPAVSCPDSLNNANRAFDQLVDDLKKQAPQWSVFSDFDAVNEVSYFIKNSCNTTQLQLVRVGPPSAIPAEEDACNELQAMLENLLEENNSSDFRGGFEGAIDTSTKGLDLGKQVGDNCQFKLVLVNDTNTTNTTDTAETPDADDTEESTPSDITPEPVPQPVPVPTLPPQDDINTPPSLVRTSFRVMHASGLHAHHKDLEEEEILVGNDGWNNEEGSVLLTIDNLEIWGYF